MTPRCTRALLTRACQLPQTTDEAVRGMASAHRNQNDRMIKLRISCPTSTTVVRFGSRLARWIAARVAEVVALVNAPDMAYAHLAMFDVS